MPNPLMLLNGQSPYAEATDPPTVELPLASGTIYRVTQSTVAVVVNGDFFDAVIWDESCAVPVVGQACLVAFDQNHAPFLIWWQGMAGG